MSKAILVMDMPETCENCECKYPSFKDNLYDCAITGRAVPINGMVYGKKPDWCPLKEIPKHREVNLDPYHLSLTEAYDCGYNNCIDEILKERD